MTVGTDNQKTPLVKIEMQRTKLDADLVKRHLETDNEAAMQHMLQSWSVADVLRPKLDGQAVGNSLHIAVKCGAEKCLKVLLSHRLSKEELEAPDDKGQTPLLTAVSKARHTALEHLLSAGANVNARDDNHKGALHLLVLNLSKDSAQGDLLRVADLLLSSTHVKKLDLEPHADFLDLTAATPLALATAKIQKEDTAPWVPNLFELCKKLVKAGASLSGDVNGATVQQVLTQKGCLTEKVLSERKHPPPRHIAAHVVDLVCMRRSGSEVREMLQGERPEDAREAVNSKLGSNSLLSYAVNIMNTSLVEELLRYGADPWLLEWTHELPLHRAAVKGHVDIFTLLVEKMKNNNKTIDLRDHSATLIKKLMENSHTKTTQNEDHLACLRHLLKEAQLDLNQKDPDLTPLHVAAKYNQQEAVRELLRAGAFLGARHVVFGKECGAALDSVLPETLEHAMDDCITHYCDDKSNKTENVVSEHYTLHLDYRFLLPPEQDGNNSDTKLVNEVETLMEVCHSERHRHLIKHPLVQTLLYAKWKKVQPLYIGNLLLYLFFVSMLTTFAYFLMDLRAIEEHLSMLQLNVTINTTSLEASKQGKQIKVHVFLVLLLLASLFMLVKMVLQIKLSFKYLKKIENWLQWSLLVIVPVLCFAPLEMDSIRQCSAWAMIIAWFVFVLKLGRVPFFALYITMLRHVTSNFLKLIVLYSLLILAFTLSFNILLYHPSGKNQSENFLSFPKAVVMSTGELEYSDMSEKFPEALSTSAIIMTLVFVFAIFLVLMNVMNALAVTDAQEVVNDTKLYSLISLLELVNVIETFLSYRIVRARLGNLQLLSGTNNTPSFLAKINHPKKHERLLSGLDHKTPNKLNDESAECLRVHRLHHLEEKRSQQLQDAVQNLADQHPNLLRSLAAALRPSQ
ncbi:transient receptor potential channel pyrexia-like isoform X1 [Portunus trituberculatus]|uniref:transient receptor potential channel pyrexia-like isoform X1 n=1 Tax=Portunus trituberculatus TaxID=210409 RepID=UPI001E1CC983|nr:transient receptor potential channel pyrexia-like isoform X1 [Portunus trituberculatus]XP_045101154.1 transient receptor potential channel pyrexia-like isoform X1 [Portunus trituberculatus]XP_045101156.1 transient receptor potential channel pyrexia-like isoform X1 [Portunus trituberculatus]XP_045101157.1 transient receptor potential channel pyrexia-like isoform X1 [Portunus trituberculatus]XP_045101158.1 transient receptor potential channel pyrexia-like isoform X1 [Portunus trituberculatus]